MKKATAQNMNANRSNASSISKGGNKSFPAQFVLKPWKPGSKPQTDKEILGDKAARIISDQVDTAHTELENGNLADASDAHKANYILRLNEYSKKGKGKKGNMHPSTAAGYVIESKVSNRLSGVDGFNFQNAKLLSGTRPDVSVDLGDGDTALIDITASKSLGHIFNKKGNWTKHKNIPYVAEAWYPSINFSGQTSKLSKEDIEEAERLAEERKEIREIQAKELLERKYIEYSENQNIIEKALTNKGKRVIEYLGNKSRYLALLENFGITIEDKDVYRMNIEARNAKLELTSRANAINPIPQYFATQMQKVLNMIESADRATAMHKSLTERQREKEREERRSRFRKKRN